MIVVFSKQRGDLPRKRNFHPYLSATEHFFDPFDQSIGIPGVVFEAGWSCPDPYGSYPPVALR
jgi:hypothetical protein